MGGRRCPFCIAKDDEIARLHKLIERISVSRVVTQVNPSGAYVGKPTFMESLQEQVEEPEAPEGAILTETLAVEYNRVHGDIAWADLSGLMKSRSDD